jgi:hypothetical protein
MNRTRLIFFVIIAVALVVVAATLVANTGNGDQVVTGLVGSEKVPFFEDERVQEALRRNGLDVTVQKAGSREIATSFDLTEYDFVFPAGVPAAVKIQQENDISRSYNPFFTPMVIGSWKPIADLLVAQGVASEQEGYYLLDMEKFLGLMEEEVRWQDLPDNDVFPANKDILITSTDVRTSNSAAMYLALASYVLNGNNIVQSMGAAEPLMPVLSGLFLRQGFRPSSSQEPFEDYLVKGMGHSPMVMMYEAQFIAQAALQDGSIQPDMVLLYPEPTIFTEHILIPITEQGEALGEALENDPELQQLAIEYGLRNNNLAAFREFTELKAVRLPANIVNVIEPPDYEVLEGMIQQIEELYRQGGAS